MKAYNQLSLYTRLTIDIYDKILNIEKSLEYHKKILALRVSKLPNNELSEYTAITEVMEAGLEVEKG